MKKAWIFLLLFALLLCCFACSKGNATTEPAQEEEKVTTVSYYDGDTLIETKKYTGEIELLDYEKEDFKLLGWYLDKEFTIPFTDEAQKGNTAETIALYAKTERIMKDYDIVIHGENKSGVVINPAFTWSENNGDTVYEVSLFYKDEPIETVHTKKPFYQYEKALIKNAEYALSVKGAESGYEDVIYFRTATSARNTVNEITLADPYEDGMVVQRDVDTLISGDGPMNQVITMIIEGERFFALSDEKGHFEVTLPKKQASFEPSTIVFTNSIGCDKILSNVLFGDVYLFGGQSNMQWPTKDSDCTSEDIENFANCTVRFFYQDVVESTEKQEHIQKDGHWFVPTENTCRWFSAISTMSGSFLGSIVGDEAPIGIVTAYQGNTNISSWTDAAYYDGTRADTGKHYNAMVYPLRHINLSGVVWYQGCNNSAAGYAYKDHLKNLFRNYRDLFRKEDLPFFVIGLACYDGDAGNNFDFSYVRESQAKACAEDENAYFISTCDDGDPTYIHPRSKRYICQRVAKSISTVLYGREGSAEGPTYRSHVVDGSTVTITLDNATGLYCTGEINGLYLAGADGKYHPAIAALEGERIVASSDEVAQPVYIKYGYGKSPFVNIFNADDFAIVPFRTDEYNVGIDWFDYDHTDVYTTHPDGSNMTVELSQGNLVVTKVEDWVGFGTIRLEKWGAIGYRPTAFRVTVIGTNSGANIQVRASQEGSGKTWGCRFTDDFTGERTFTMQGEEMSALTDAFVQKIQFVELVIESEGVASITLCEARFVEE